MENALLVRRGNGVLDGRGRSGPFYLDRARWRWRGTGLLRRMGRGCAGETGGALDRIKAPRAFLTDRTKTLPLERRADYIEIAVTGAGDVRLVEDGLAAREDARAGGKTKTVFHAKAGRRDTLAVLDLELIPVAANGSTFTLQLRGQPLAKTEVKVFGPPKWQKSLRTDDQGRVTLQTPWAGRYVVEVVHVEEKPGEPGGEAYNRLRHVSTLSFVVEEGIAWTAP